MSKSTPKRSRGRPPLDDSLGERVLVRLDKPTKAALQSYAAQTGAVAEATAVRMILVEKLRGMGFLK